MKLHTPLWIVFWILVADFISLILIFAFNWSFEHQWSRTNIPDILGVLAVCLVLGMPLLGIALLVLTLRGKIGGSLKKFLILTGSAPFAIPIGAAVILVLTLVYGDENLDIIGPFFLVAAVIFIAAIVFLVGVMGSITYANVSNNIAAKEIKNGRPEN